MGARRSNTCTAAFLTAALLGSPPSAWAAGGDQCAPAADPPVPITALPFTDSGDTCDNTSSVSTLPPGCSTYMQMAGGDQIYVIEVGGGTASR